MNIRDVLFIALSFLLGWIVASHKLIECAPIEEELIAMYETQALIEEEAGQISDYLVTKYTITPARAEYLSEAIIEVSRIYNVPSTLIAAMANAESSFNPRAQSNAGAIGIMQVMPFWINNKEFRRATGINNVDQLWNLRLSLHAGAYILSHYIKEGGSIEAGIKAYHGGYRAWTSPKASTIYYYNIVISNFERI